MKIGNRGPFVHGVAVALLLVFAVPRRAAADPLYMAAANVAQQAMQNVADAVGEIRDEALTEKRASELRDKVRDTARNYVSAIDELKVEITRLETNKELNAPLIAELNKALAHAETAKKRLIVLQDVMKDDKSMLAAKKSGFLVKALREAADAMGGSARAIALAHNTLATTGNDKPGFVEILELTVSEGDMRFFMTDYDPGKGLTDVQIRAGMKVPVRKLPIIIRAAVYDDEKKRLTDQESKGVIGTIEFKPVTDATKGHKFVYQGKPGTTTWTAREEYTWTPDTLGPTKERIRALAQRNSDPSTKQPTGDQVEIHPTEAVAQKLTFDVSGTCVRWERFSELVNKQIKTEQVVPKNNTAKARLVLSVFPAK